MPNDEFYVIDSHDPSLLHPGDTSVITSGFMMISVEVKPQAGIEPTLLTIEKRGLLGGVPIIWKTATDRLPDGGTYYMREVVTRDLFSVISPELARSPIHLHVYIAGSDPSEVDTLAGVAATIGFKP
jgi:hypothetical protein